MHRFSLQEQGRCPLVAAGGTWAGGPVVRALVIRGAQVAERFVFPARGTKRDALRGAR